MNERYSGDKAVATISFLLLGQKKCYKRIHLYLRVSVVLSYTYALWQINRRFVMETWYYVVESIDGDYANLKRTDIESEDLKLVARALLPEGIAEGTKLKYEFMQYSIV